MMNTLKYIALTAAVVFLGSCKLVTDYDFDLSPDGLRNEPMLSYFETSFDKTRTEYVKAMRYAGLEGVVATGGVTCVVPNNSAFGALYQKYGVNSIEQMPRTLVRSLLEYLIFPGNYRCLEMVEGENHRCTALDGNPIWIKRSSSSSNSYLIVVNDTPGLISGAAYNVVQQDFLFRDGVVAQVVGTFPVYQPMVTPTEEGILHDSDPRTQTSDVIDVSDDTYVYGLGPSTVRGAEATVRLSRTVHVSEVRMGAVRFILREISFANDIASAILNIRLLKTDAYAVGDDLKISFYEMPNADWGESSAKWVDIVASPGNTFTAYRPLLKYAGSCQSVVPAQYSNDNPIVLGADITECVISKYASVAPAFGAPLAIAMLDESPNNGLSQHGIHLCSKEGVAPEKYVMSIKLSGYVTYSHLAMKHNKPIQTDASGIALLTPAESFEFAGDNSDGYDYAPHNIIYVMHREPAAGMVTKYGVPVGKNGRFTQAEMEAGVVKFISTAEGGTDFDLKVLDYLNAIYVPDTGNPAVNYITVTVQ